MKRVHVLGGVLAALLLAAGVLYVKGYWHSWEDKRAEVLEVLRADTEKNLQADPSIPADVGYEYSDCVGNGAVNAMIEAGCPLDGLKEAIPQIKECTEQDPSAALMVLMTVLQCGMEAQAKLEATAPQPAQ